MGTAPPPPYPAMAGRASGTYNASDQNAGAAAMAGAERAKHQPAASEARLLASARAIVSTAAQVTPASAAWITRIVGSVRPMRCAQWSMTAYNGGRISP